MTHRKVFASSLMIKDVCNQGVISYNSHEQSLVWVLSM